MRVRRLLMTTALVLAYLVSMGTPASPAPQDGTLTIGVHVTLVIAGSIPARQRR